MAKLSMEDTMRARFHQATAERDAMVAKAAPLRAKYDAVSAEIEEMRQKKLEPVVEALKVAEDGLFELNQEIGKITRFLREGNFAATGDAPAKSA